MVLLDRPMQRTFRRHLQMDDDELRIVAGTTLDTMLVIRRYVVYF